MCQQAAKISRRLPRAASIVRLAMHLGSRSIIRIQFAPDMPHSAMPSARSLRLHPRALMAGFRMHVTTSAVLGCGYAGVGHAVYGVPLDTSLVAGAMCGFSGMLPDLDSDYGVPLRETMAFTAAIVPMLLVGHFQSLRVDARRDGPGRRVAVSCSCGSASRTSSANTRSTAACSTAFPRG